ncbi:MULTISPECIES: bifunctional diaminohydroxyphosphoribosylaminopyrimidine deaminase/5-amino-6-(5-phosphoribosylamino)uracil reductase RibD [Helicobacter]|uniref:Riboflavin biosynthesis protein RibD n=1 Tax=Helicobacter ibis TaxID=2962633 RepID=A0ABT4VFA8_9HELI|nr:MULTISPECIES: bifunctional diaminohydroxyphosphoribosylaminopyrimidine deaminase/5-amino-6-(5-phosphoribosylamino)uracil reductase RibD [Helicobacter]MDA3967681.1 bifunctional diaminohydroxyphosphoribosylaminopyrimidine deaminase/5-amino-6-(5-phosphoribosylamino)uracil reductase RibD [Helicobacter sp. WB40]MDA3969399.1 bifunctional diaminohydroxyphosphoribosylaminopyrimidine deaminase/5-amino-6-(5-phosphoribosylamino)uracil reductase RibD [Helicobacter ibis]
MVDDSFYLNLAINRAWEYQCITIPNPAVGALVIDKNGQILSIQAHKEVGTPHAEVLALKESYIKLTNDNKIENITDSAEIHKYLLKNAKSIFNDITMYVTLSPCTHVGKTPSCANLLKELKVKKIIIGSEDINKNAQGGGELLEQNGIEVIYAYKQQKMQKVALKAKELLLPFISLQSKDSFVLFKYASRLNGSIDGGRISNESSQIFMHNIRTKVDNLLISGKTIMLDNPTLDCRYATLDNKKAPNITILTRNKNLPQNAPLFHINREITITNTPPKPSGFIMIEGGISMLESLIDMVDMILLFLSPTISQNTLIHTLNLNLKILHTSELDGDLLIWLAKK